MGIRLLALGLACIVSSVVVAPSAAYAQQRRRPLTVGRQAAGNTTSTSNSVRPTCGASNANDETWTFTPPATASYEIAVTSDWDNVLAVFDPAGGNRELGCNDDTNGRNAALTVQLTAGHAYTVVVDGYGDAHGRYTLMAQRIGGPAVPPGPPPVPPPPLPPEQEPTRLAVGTHVFGGTENSRDQHTPSCGGQAGSLDDVWKFVPTANDTYRVRVIGQFDSMVAVLDAQRRELACNDDALRGRDPMVSVAMTAGREYFIVVDGFQGTTGRYELFVESATTTPEPRPAPLGGVLASGQRIVGSTSRAPDSTTPVCGGAMEHSGDNVWAFRAPRAGLYRMQVDGNFTAVVQLEDGERPIACVGAASARRPAEIIARLEADHEYRVVVDGASGAEGTFRLLVDDRVPARARVTPTLPDLGLVVVPTQAATEDPAAMRTMCTAAAVLRPGRNTGAIAVGPGTAVVSCGRPIAAGDAVHRLDITRRAHVRIREASDFDAVVELRRACTGGAAVACVDDAPDPRHSGVEADLDPGTYYVIVDTVSPGTGGAYTLDVEIRP